MTAPDALREATNVTVLIAAHNEATVIAPTIRSLQAQSRAPDRMVVVADRCTDGTEVVAAQAGAEVFRTVGNEYRKAGALNQALDYVLPGMADTGFVMTADADITPHPDVIANWLKHFYDNPAIGAMSAAHTIGRRKRMLEMMQAMEFERDRRYIGRKQGIGSCLSGSGSIFRVSTLRELHAKHGEYYRRGAWTEDWMITFAVKHYGRKILKPQDCKITTTPAPTWRQMFRQRQRWSQGYVETICRFGLTRYTVLPWAGVGLWAFCLVVWLSWMGIVGWSLARGGAFHLAAWFILVLVLFIAARVITVRKLGRRAMVIAGLMLPELAYEWWRNIAASYGTIKHLTGMTGKW